MSALTPPSPPLPEFQVCLSRPDISAWIGGNTGIAGITTLDSGLPGPKGNREFFLVLVHDETARLPEEIDGWIDAATG